ncbi:hypothetical protein NL676_037836 [Syzygium grande]|nr:hypothetical protein NL676_037836 [Syzygium grande]
MPFSPPGHLPIPEEREREDELQNLFSVDDGSWSIEIAYVKMTKEMQKERSRRDHKSKGAWPPQARIRETDKVAPHIVKWILFHLRQYSPSVVAGECGLDWKRTRKGMTTSIFPHSLQMSYTIMYSPPTSSSTIVLM